MFSVLIFFKESIEINMNLYIFVDNLTTQSKEFISVNFTMNNNYANDTFCQKVSVLYRNIFFNNSIAKFIKYYQTMMFRLNQ